MRAARATGARRRTSPEPTRRADAHRLRAVGKTLVTGGNGFIGSAVVRLLAERGDDLRLTRRRRSRDENLAGVEYEAVECDILDRTAVRRALRGVDRVYHCAGLVSIRPADTERVFEVNVRGTRTVLEECLRADVERVVY